MIYEYGNAKFSKRREKMLQDTSKSSEAVWNPQQNKQKKRKRMGTDWWPNGQSYLERRWLGLIKQN